MNIQPNPYFMKCISKVTNGAETLKKLDFRVSNIEFSQVGSMFMHIPKIRFQSYIAAFDIDWTISYSEETLIQETRNPLDVHLIPGRAEILLGLFKKGYTIVLFTNQYTKKDHSKKIERITNILLKLPFPCLTFIATDKDEYRKPLTLMWDKLLEYVTPQYAFYVGDALGRPQDFSDADKVFAENIGIPYYSPEEFFPELKYTFNTGKNMIITVGMPGSGKSSYYKHNFENLDYTLLSRDTIGGDKKKILRVVKKNVLESKDIYIDATNPKIIDRQVYYDLAQEYGYDITVIYFIRNGFGWNALREKKVPTIAYRIYFKNLDPPTPYNTPGRLCYVT